MKFELGAKVAITCSGETGEVIGRAQYAYAETSYFIRYKEANGKAVETWWTESALTAA